MYQLIVRHVLRKAFRDINRGAYQRIVPQFLPRHRHVMYGQHALGGERRSLQATTQWYLRLQRLLPDLQFDVRSIAVAGWPWHTTAMVAWNDRFTLPDGSAGTNHGVHEFVLHWGRVRSLVVHCDTARLERYCERMAAAGIAEARAAPIVDIPVGERADA
jgi:hypothetical protein